MSRCDMIQSFQQFRRAALPILVVVMLLLGSFPVTTMAAAPAIPTGTTASPAGGASSDVCTNFALKKAQMFGGAPPAAGTPANTGLLSGIYVFIQGVVGKATQNLFYAFTTDARYQNALGAVFTLMVVFFGVGFTMGLVQISYGQVLIRLVKMGVVMTLISPSGWFFFSTTVVAFFNQGTDDLVKTVITIGTNVAAPPGASPFYQFDQMAAFLITPDTIVAMMGMLTSGPYSLAMTGLMAVAMFGFVSLLIEALKKYAVCYVVRSMMLGLAPVFFTFLLFEKTKQLFMGWLNSILSTALQPILMFTFLSFFMVLIESASQDMLSTEFCWTDCKNVQGSENPVSCFRPVDPNTKQTVKSEMTWNGAVSCLLNAGSGAGGAAGATGGATGGGASCPESYMNIINILTFLILVFIAKSFSELIEGIANELANSQLSLDSGGKIGGFIGQQAGKIGDWVTGKSPPASSQLKK